VLKPARGAGGSGIVVIVGRDGARFRKPSGAQLRRRDLEAHACDVIGGAFSPGSRSDLLLVEERVVPEPALGALAYRGVPDVRVLVFRGVPVLAMLRLSTRRSDGRANLHLGGVGVGIDLGRGVTTSAVCHGRAVAVHPDLGLPLAGVPVPAWDDVLTLAVRAADAVGLGFVGVDVVLDARHGPLVLELNARPGLTIQVANRRGLRPVLEALAAAELPSHPGARVALARVPS
jgi:alpha-L-glutamate ligase-like protein